MTSVPTDATEDEISAPIVFQCCKCNRIVGDSLSFVTTNPENETITLSAASNIKGTGEFFTPKEGRHDVGCTYSTFNCQWCKVRTHPFLYRNIELHLITIHIHSALSRQVVCDDIKRSRQVERELHFRYKKSFQLRIGKSRTREITCGACPFCGFRRWEQKCDCSNCDGACKRNR